MVESYLLDATRSSHSIDGLALERAGYRAGTEQELTGKGVKAVALDAVPAASLLDFAGERADLPLTLADGSTRTFLEDGDEVVLRGADLGEVRGRVLSSGR